MSSGADEGVGITYALEGDAILTAYSRIRASGWTVSIGIPTVSVDAGAWRSSLAYGGGVLLSALLGCVAALLIARSISRPIGELRRAAQALGRGETVTMPASEIREVQERTHALSPAPAQ